jgi:magnesium-transporting ATPase (P-type)
MSHRYQTLDFSIEKEEFKSVPLSTISPSSNTLTLLKEILLNLQLSSFLQVLLDPYMIWFLFMLILSFLPFASILSLKLFLLLPFFLLLIIKQLKTFISFRSQLQFQSRINSQGVALSSAQAFSVRESKNIHQGDFFVIRKNEVSPCDCFILFIDNDSENCFVRKQDLDNPEELEKRSPVKETSEIIENEGLNLEILRNSIESLQVRTSPGSSLKELAGFIGIRSHSELIQVSYFNMVHSGDVVLECEWILCIAVSVGRETQCWIDYEFNLAKCQGSHFYHVRRTQFKSLVFIVFCIVLNAGLSRGSEKNGSAIESVFFSLVIFGFNLPVCIYLIFEIVEILNFCIVRKKFKDISVNSSQSLSKLAAVEYVLSEKVGVVSKRLVDVVFCIVSGTVYQETLLENEEEPLKRFSSFSTKKIRNSLNFCSFVTLFSPRRLCRVLIRLIRLLRTFRRKLGLIL